MAAVHGSDCAKVLLCNDLVALNDKSMRVNRRTKAVFAVAIVLAALTVSTSVSGQDVVTIGVVADGPYGRLGDETKEIRDEIVNLLSIDFQVEVAPDKQIEADWTLTSIQAGIDRLLADADVDLVLTTGVVGSHLVSRMGDLPKPVVAAFIIDADFQGLPRREAGSGVENLNYISVHDLGDLPAFREIIPFTRLGLLVDARFAEAIPEMEERVRVAAGESGLEVQVVPVGASVDTALEALAPDLEAVYLLPLLQLSRTDLSQLVQGLNTLGLPSMSWLGEREVRQGLMLGRMPAGFSEQIARRAALNMQRALLGDPLDEMAVEYPTAVRLMLNVATADAVGFSPAYTLLGEATLVDADATAPARQLTLETAVLEAVAENLDLQVEDRFLAVAAQNTELAGSTRLPQIDLGLDFSTIDKNRAERSFGSSPQVLLSGAATIRQVIYADRFWADVEAETLTQTSRELDRDTLRLDVSLEAAVLYLDLLRAKTFEQIARDNVNLSRSNLELARLRVSVGTAAPGEVFRWEAQIANDRLTLVEASAQTRVGEVQLNRLLNQPTDQPFGTEETAVDDPGLLSSQERLYPYLSTPREFAVFRRFMALEALERAPELQAIDSLSLAQERVLTSTRRSKWLPEFGVEGGVSGWFARAGAGSDSQPSFDLPGGGMLELTQVDSFQWFAGAFATIPIFEGTAKVARETQSAEELARLRVQRASVSQKIDARLRSGLLEMQASLLGIALAQQAADAAHANLDIVTDTYRRGAATVIELLDAQQAALSADQNAAKVTFQFLIDLMRVQRAVNRFDFFTTAQETDDFFNRLASFREAASQTARP